MANLASKLKSFLETEWHKLEPSAVQALESFEQKVTPDALKLMQDAIVYAATLGLSNADARAAAITQFIKDGKTAIADIASWAESDYNLLLELVYKVTAAKLTTGAGPASTTA